MKKGKDGFYCKYIKRLLDVTLSALALVLLSPVLLLVALVIRLKLGAPVLFCQQRIGRDGKPFRMYKFRSMSDDRDEKGELLPDAQRISRFGALLRASSVDELPAFLNVLKGDMGIIGPRPLPVEYQPYFTPQEQARHSVRGGISGLAQVNGRNALQWEQRFAYDLEYVNKVSFSMDVKIAFQTVGKVFRRSDIGLRGVTGPEDFNVYRMRQWEGVK